jgi:hypothetical protein
MDTLDQSNPDKSTPLSSEQQSAFIRLLCANLLCTVQGQASFATQPSQLRAILTSKTMPFVLSPQLVEFILSHSATYHSLVEAFENMPQTTKKT